jgi:RsiW-degrading membrane proteinase PrsW (M82 family)
MSNDPDAIIRTLRPYLLHPGSIFAVLAAISGFVPLIEEAVKPVGLWFLAGRGLTPQEGFVGGLLSGAGFAFFESLGIAGSYSSENWTTLVLARAGTSLLHITTTALVGYGLAGAWQQRRFVRLGAVFLSAVALHGLWNALSIGSSITQLFGDALTGNAGGNTWLSFGATAAPWGLGFLVVLLLGILIGMNAWLRKPNLAGQPQPE